MVDCVSVAELPRMREEYDRLYRDAAPDNLFLTRAWLELRLDHFDGGSHRILVHRDGGRLLAVAVLCEEDGRWRTLEGHTYWPGVLAHPDLALPHEPFAQYLHGIGVREVDLYDSPNDDAFRAVLYRALEGRYLPLAREDRETRAIHVDQSLDAYLSSRPSKVRAELKRKVRKLSREAGDGGLRCYAGSEARETALAACESIEHASWKADAQTAIVSAPDELAFYRSVYDLDADDVKGTLYILHGSTEPLAYVLGVRHGKRFYALKASYRDSHASLSPGQVIFYLLIEELCRDPAIERIELLGVDSRWKRELASSAQLRCTYTLHRDDLRGRSFVFAHERLKPAYQQLLATNEHARKAEQLVRAGLKRARELSKRDPDSGG